MHRPEYKHARFGLLVSDCKTGETLFAHEPEQLFTPASTTKLYSCSAALLALGSDHRFKTPVRRRGEIRAGKLVGDLVLDGQGDPSLGGRTNARGGMDFKNNDHIYANGQPIGEVTDTDPLAGLKELAKQIAEAGIKRIEGDVLIDDRLFDHGRSSGSGPAVVSPVMVNDNCIDVVTYRCRSGQGTRWCCALPSAFYHWDADVVTVARDKPLAVEITATGPRSIKVRNQIRSGQKPLVRCARRGPRNARALLMRRTQGECRAGMFDQAATLPVP